MHLCCLFVVCFVVGVFAAAVTLVVVVIDRREPKVMVPRARCYLIEPMTETAQKPDSASPASPINCC